MAPVDRLVSGLPLKNGQQAAKRTIDGLFTRILGVGMWWLLTTSRSPPGQDLGSAFDLDLMTSFGRINPEKRG